MNAGINHVMPIANGKRFWLIGVGQLFYMEN
jgi:hypothetical protein